MEAILSAAAVVWRHTGDGPEVLLARRRPRMRFFGGVHAFCGGRVDPVDERLGAAADPADPRRGALRSALARELVEELGLDARHGGAASPGLGESLVEDAERWAAACAAGELGALPEPCLRLVTPEFYPRRFDTWFFLVEATAAYRPRLQEAELDGGGFDRPAGWLARWHAGEFRLAPPTVIMLEALAAHPVGEWAGALRRLQAEVEDPRHLQPIRTDPAVRLLPLRTPTLPPARHTNAFLVGHGEAWLVDPATPWAAEQGLLAATLDRARDAGASVQGILLTHHHADHVGAATAMAAHLDVPVLAHAGTARRLADTVRVDRLVDDGDRLPFVHEDGQPGELRAVFTPGHAPGHLCFHEPRYGGLLAGDMVSTLSSILVDPEDGDMSDYLRSLQRLVELGPACVYPAHGPADARGTAVLADQIRHRAERARQVVAAVPAEGTDLDALTRAVYGDVPRPMLGYARKSAVSVLRLLEREGRVRLDGDRVWPVAGSPR